MEILSEKKILKEKKNLIIIIASNFDERLKRIPFAANYAELTNFNTSLVNANGLINANELVNANGNIIVTIIE